MANIQPIYVKNPGNKLITIGKHIIRPGDRRYVQFDSLEHMNRAMTLREQGDLIIETELPPDILEGAPASNTNNEPAETSGGSSSASRSKIFRDDFSGNEIDPAAWDVTLDPVQTITIADSKVSIYVPTGKSKTIFRTKETFQLPCRVEYQWVQSAREHDVQIELISEDGQDRVGLAYRKPESPWLMKNFGQFHGDYKEAASNISVYQTTADGIVSTMEIFEDRIMTFQRALTPSSTSSLQAEQIWSERMPDPNKKYHLQITVGAENASLPATSHFHSVMVKEFPGGTTTDRLGGRGAIHRMHATPVLLAGAENVVRVHSEGARVMAQRYQMQVFDFGPLVPDSYYTMSVLLYSESAHAMIYVVSDQECTLIVEGMVKNVYYEVERAIIQPGKIEYLIFPVVVRNLRARLVMGATPSTMGVMGYVVSTLPFTP